ncbi:15-hydroxyprostaglandin dehydrogenase [NAD(+)]-like [Bicyclus anynana]|uniref:15-hydroxyprostaglandin dehydrogenase [NAD(+)] n=1 Tax=Bicyclus anynana TaxID=110368 RepID=A0ABM3LFF8_BICAN|nr:15-hydroxyprostaglandin dehydrogenase [NAD(+)]-like [Bicyclus anynana]
MAHSLNGKVALVTGGASGIGACTVRSLLEEGAKHVAVLDIEVEAGNVLQNELNTKYGENKVTFIECDVTNKETLVGAFNAVQEQNGYIDVVVNNAGILDDTPENFERTININLTSLIRSSLHSWKIMHKEKGGSGGTIINFSSVAGLLKFEAIPIYSATKTAVLKFSTCLGDETHYTRSGVRVLAMCFGVTDTPILENNTKLFDETAKINFKEFKLQRPESAGKAVTEAYKQGTSASVWLSNADEPALDVTKDHSKSMESALKVYLKMQQQKKKHQQQKQQQ